MIVFHFLQFVRCRKPNEIPVHLDQLTPINEEPAEDMDEDQPITMIPKIMHTAPSPTTDIPPTSNVTSTTTVNHEQTPRHGDSIKTNRNSIADETITEATIEAENERKPMENGTSAAGNREISQIESVL